MRHLCDLGLVISKGALKTGVLLLKGNKLASPEEIINQSIEGLEFEIVQGIQQLLPPGTQEDRFLRRIFDYPGDCSNGSCE